MVLPSQSNRGATTTVPGKVALDALRPNFSVFQRTNPLFSSRTDLNPATVMHTDSLASDNSQAAQSAKHRFRQQYHQKKTQQEHQQQQPRQQIPTRATSKHQRDIEGTDGDITNQKPEQRVARAVGFIQTEMFCPNCSLPLLQQDLATSKAGGARVILCSSSSSTNTTTRTFTNNGSYAEDFSINDIDSSALELEKKATNGNNQKGSSHDMDQAACGLMLPMESILEHFVGTYCDSVCVDQIMTSHGRGAFMGMSKHDQGQDENRVDARQVPPYCANCKAFIVQETGQKQKREKMLTNLAVWLATSSSSSSSDDGESDDRGKVSKVSFRPSRGSIKVVLDNDEPHYWPDQSAKIGPSSLSPQLTQQGSKSLPQSPIFDIASSHGEEPMEWDTLMQRRTPRLGMLPRNSYNISSRGGDRYNIDDPDLLERKSYGSSSSVGRSPRRRRPSLHMLVESAETVPQHQTNALQVKTNAPYLLPQSKFTGFEQGAAASNTASPKSQRKSKSQRHDVRESGNPAEREVSSPTVPKFLANEPKTVEMKVMDILTKQEDVVDSNVIIRATPTMAQSKIKEDQTMPLLEHRAQDHVDNDSLEHRAQDHDDNDSVGTCYTLKEEATIIKDYEKKRDIATKAIGRKLMEGYTLTQTQCDHCLMPVMERNGISECVVCPLVAKKAKKRADLRRKGQAIMATFDSSDSPPKRKLECSTALIPNCPIEERDAEEESKGPFEAMKERAEEQDGILIQQQDEDHDSGQDNFSPWSDASSRAPDEGAHDAIMSPMSDTDAHHEKESNCSGSDVYDMEIGSQEVYRRLLDGWLLTNMICSQCQSPLMQSSTGDIECVVCNRTGSEISSPSHHISQDKFDDAQEPKNTGHVTTNDTRVDINEHAAVDSLSPKAPLIFSDGNGLRYLALPENLDMDDHEALVAFLGESQRQKKMRAARSFTFVKPDLAEDQVFAQGTEEADDSNRPLSQITSSSIDHRAPGGFDYGPESSFNVSNNIITRTNSPLKGSQRQLESYERRTVSSQFSHESKRNKHWELSLFPGDDDPQKNLRDDWWSRDHVASPSGDADGLSMIVSDFEPHSFARGKEMVRQKADQYPLSDLRRDSSRSNEGKSYESEGVGIGFRSRSSSAPRSSQYSPEKERLLDVFSRSPEKYVREETPRSETGAIFDSREDDNLILKFDKAKSFPSDEFDTRTPSPRRSRPSFSRGNSHQQDDAALDPIVDFTIRAQSSRLESRCHSCNNTLRCNTMSHAALCVNPQCPVYMIPVQSMNIFTSVMKDAEKVHYQEDRTGDLQMVRRSAHIRSFSTESRDDRLRKGIPSYQYSISSKGSDGFIGVSRRKSFRGNVALFDEDIDSRVSSVDSSNCVSTDDVNMLLSRMGGTSHSLPSNVCIETNARSNEKSEMTLLIDRLASAAVAIKDLEQSVQEVESNSPDRLFAGRPPTSPKARPSLNESERDKRWF